MNVDAFILIGGRSTRLGRDKAFVELGGRSLVSRAVQTLQGEFARLTVVAGNSLQFATQAIADGVPFIFDLYENRGPLGGIHAALANTNTPWIFVLACDYPFVSTDVIRLLRDRVSDEFGAIIPEQDDGRLQPLCAFYKVELVRPEVEAVLEKPRVSPPLNEVAARLNPLIVKFDEYSHLPNAEDLFVNINTVEDFQHATDKLSISE